jgi:hypothetical protein
MGLQGLLEEVLSLFCYLLLHARYKKLQKVDVITKKSPIFTVFTSITSCLHVCDLVWVLNYWTDSFKIRYGRLLIIVIRQDNLRKIKSEICCEYHKPSLHFGEMWHERCAYNDSWLLWFSPICSPNTMCLHTVITLIREYHKPSLKF